MSDKNTCRPDVVAVAKEFLQERAAEANESAKIALDAMETDVKMGLEVAKSVISQFDKKLSKTSGLAFKDVTDCIGFDTGHGLSNETQEKRRGNGVGNGLTGM